MSFYNILFLYPNRSTHLNKFTYFPITFQLMLDRITELVTDLNLLEQCLLRGKRRILFLLIDIQ